MWQAVAKLMFFFSFVTSLALHSEQYSIWVHYTANLGVFVVFFEVFTLTGRAVTALWIYRSRSSSNTNVLHNFFREFSSHVIFYFRFVLLFIWM